MEEVLTAVMKALAESPQLALWALAIIYGFKVVVIGSIYGTARFVVERLHSAYTTPKHTLQVVDIEAKLRSMSIEEPESLIAQLERLRGVSMTITSKYMHRSDIQWLREAIDDKLAKEEKRASRSITV